LLSNLFDFNPAEDIVTYDQLPESDRYILHRLAVVTKDVTEAYDNFQFSRFFQTIQTFCTVDLSNFYLDIAKDRLYISAANSPRRRSCQTVLMYCLEAITKAIAPVLAHTSEDIWQHLPYPAPTKSVFQSGWITSHDEWHKPELATKWEYLREVRSEVNKVLEAARNNKVIGSSLDAMIWIWSDQEAIQANLESLGEQELKYLFITSQVKFVRDMKNIINIDTDWELLPYRYESKDLTFAAFEAKGDKCPRCWNYSTHIGESAEHPHICDRCVGALAGTF
jgi:isoleucyl-tRNA synthetase